MRVWRWIRRTAVSAWASPWRRRVLWALLAIFVICQLVGQTLVLPSDARSVTQTLCDGAVYTRSYWQGVRVHRIEVDLHKVRPVLLTSPTLARGKRALIDLVKANPEPVVAAVNGDYFDASGPQGALISLAGIVRAPSRNRMTLGFDKVATVFPYRFATTAKVVLNGDPFPLEGCLNSPYEPGEVGIFTHERGTSFGWCPVQAVQLLVKVDKTDNSRRTERVVGRVERVARGRLATLTPAHEGEIVVVASNQTGLPDDFPGSPVKWATKAKSGDKVELSLALMPKREPIAISGGPQILRQGKYILDEDGNPKAACLRLSRTVVGISTDGYRLAVMVFDGPPKPGTVGFKEIGSMAIRLKVRSLLRATCENIQLFVRWGWHHVEATCGLKRISRGATLRDVALYCYAHPLESGAPISDVLNLDGGSSSTLVLRDTMGLHVRNFLTEGKQADLPTGLGFAPRPEHK